ncbi:hypothetical protein QMG52_20910 [Paenarthrobacter sp. PH39-S1]|nr:hypothetical protein [Paenarthrobacter sp. PH39-S1]MDJ0358468.1 hypothetical protein [Paenarthrobacter sp. PH39-S1]
MPQTLRRPRNLPRIAQPTPSISDQRPAPPPARTAPHPSPSRPGTRNLAHRHLTHRTRQIPRPRRHCPLPQLARPTTPKIVIDKDRSIIADD